jgi:uncharacterized repeat protein (TIGR03803 family)
MSCSRVLAVMFASLALPLVLAGSGSAQTFTTITYFSDGSSVLSALIQGRDGNLYGTSNDGGAGGQGSVFKVTPTGFLTTLHSFCSESNCTDGYYPFSTLSLGTDGNFYGTTQNGGANGTGVVFKITTGGTYTVLHSFGGADGSYPDAGPALGADGNFYGTTSSGGISNGGTVFKISPSGTFTTLHSFSGNDGVGPAAPLIQGTDRNFYGTTLSGGTSNACSAGCGTVFRITPDGKFVSLHSLAYTDGQAPYAPLVQAADGAFYGTTLEGGNVDWHGCYGGCGTIFKITSGGTFATVHKFDGSDGGRTYAGLVQATDGNVYSETEGVSSGEIFKLTLPNAITTLYTFSASSQGGGTTPVVQGTSGKFYGTYGVPGAVFSFDTGLGPFVAFVLPSGKVGHTAQILGQGLTGTTSVTFNGVPATSFSVVSDTFMTAVVPSGATTGPVVVTTPAGALTSNVSFRISK